MQYSEEQIKAIKDLCSEFKKFRHSLAESQRLEEAKKSLLSKEFSFSKHLKKIISQ